MANGCVTRRCLCCGPLKPSQVLPEPAASQWTASAGCAGFVCPPRPPQPTERLRCSTGAHCNDNAHHAAFPAVPRSHRPAAERGHHGGTQPKNATEGRRLASRGPFGARACGRGHQRCGKMGGEPTLSCLGERRHASGGSRRRLTWPRCLESFALWAPPSSQRPRVCATAGGLHRFPHPHGSGAAHAAVASPQSLFSNRIRRRLLNRADDP